MGKLETIGLVVALAAVIGMQRTGRPAEQGLVTTSAALMHMTRAELTAWCGERDGRVVNALDATGRGHVSCAWLDAETELVLQAE